MVKYIFFFLSLIISINFISAQNTNDDLLRKGAENLKAKREAKNQEKIISKAKALGVSPQEILKEDNTKRKSNKEVELMMDKKFYWLGMVPEEDGLVTFKKEIPLNKKTNEQAYAIIENYSKELIDKSNHSEISQIAYNEPNEGKIIVSLCEDMIFSKRKWEEDMTLFYYQLKADITKNTATIRLTNIQYKYEEQREIPTLYTKAEDWINDKYAFNAKKTKLAKQPAKFRRKTIDRMNEVLNEIESLIK